MADNMERIGKAGFYGGRYRPAGSFVDKDLIPATAPEPEVKP